MQQKVSVVVPIYKVEEYIDRCVQSILKQSYKNIEVILVDDGSPDNCGKIAESYSLRDERVRVYHKDNGGLSDARNYGIRFVTGDFTLFVDSDDWLSKDIIDQLVSAGRVFDADVVQSAFFYEYKDHLLFDDRYYSMNSRPIMLNNQELMDELVVNERVKNFAWGKLYKTCLIKDIPFKKGVLFEDVFWAHKVMQRVNKYVMLNKPMYYYYQRSNSIVAGFSLRNLDIIRGLQERHHFIIEYYSHLTNKSYKIILKTCLEQYNLLLRSKGIDEKGIHRKEIKNYINENYRSLMGAVKGDIQLKIRLYLFRILPVLNCLPLIINKALRKFKLIPEPFGLKRIDIHGPNSTVCNIQQ